MDVSRRELASTWKSRYKDSRRSTILSFSGVEGLRTELNFKVVIQRNAILQDLN